MGELIVNGIKWSFIIGVSLTFMTAITTIVSLVISNVMTGVIGEVLGIISNCLPFSATAVIGGAFTICNAVLSFMIAQKVYELVSGRINV